MKIVNTKHYTTEECVELNKYFRRIDFDIVIKSEETRNNGGLRGVAKLFLNSLWGKFGTREIVLEYTYVRTQAELIQIMSNPHLRFLNSHTIHYNLVEVIYERNPEYSNPPAYVSHITAVFTTSNARVRLWKFISYLHPSQLLYCDTDSCYYVWK